MAKIAFFELEPWEKEYVKKRLKGHKLKFVDGHLDESSASKIKDCDAVAVFIFSEISGKLLAKLPKLKMITTMSTGFDHIDTKACKKKKIIACNVPEYGSDTVAEHTIALMLAISKKIVESVEHTRRGKFSQEGLRGFDLKGKTLGIVGTGKIGKNVVIEDNCVVHAGTPSIPPNCDVTIGDHVGLAVVVTNFTAHTAYVIRCRNRGVMIDGRTGVGV